MLRLLFSLPRPVPSASASLLRLYLRRLFACYAAGTCFSAVVVRDICCC